MRQPVQQSHRSLARIAGWGATGIIVCGLLASFLKPLDAAFTACLAVMMILISISDFRRFIVPDMLSLPAIPIGILANSMVLHDAVLSGLQESLIGILAGGGAFYLIRVAFYWLRGTEGLGMGDVKLAAVAGAWLGPALLPETCLGATLAALAFSLAAQIINGNNISYKLKIPFGSFIAPAIIAAWAFRLWEAGGFVS